MSCNFENLRRGKYQPKSPSSCVLVFRTENLWNNAEENGK